MNGRALKALPGLTQSLVLGVRDEIQTVVLYIQTSSALILRFKSPSDQMLQLTGDRTGKKEMNGYHTLPNERIEQGTLP